MDSCRCNASMGLMPEEKRSFHAEKAVFVRIEEVFMKRFCLLSLSLLCLLLAACGGNTPDTPAKEEPPAPVETDTGGEATDNLRPDKNTLVIAIADEVEGLDVQQIGYGNHVHTLIGEQLVAYNLDLTELYPAFAESYTLTDEYIEFVLPANAKFSNGDPLDAAALKASTERYLAISQYAGDLDALSSIEIMDERTVRYHFSEPAPYCIASIASVFGTVTDVAEVERVGEWEYNRKPVTNGAYCVEDWVAGSHVTLKRNEYFRTSNPGVKNHGVSNFETVIVRFIPDAEERMRELEAGNVDIVINAPVSRRAELEANPNYHVYSYRQPGVSYLNLQTQQGVLEDIRVREALTYAVDRNALNKALGDAVTPFYGFIVPAMAGYSAEEEAKLAQKLAYDPERAKALLAEAGWADKDGDGILEKDGAPLSFDMLLPSDKDSLKTAGPVLVEQFAAIGAEAKVHYFEADYIKELMHANEYEIGSRAFEWNDADMLYWCFTGDSGYGWDDPELTALLTAARHTSDLEKRVEVYAAVSERLAQDFKAISLFSDNYIIVTRRNVNGLLVATDDRIWFHDVTKD